MLIVKVWCLPAGLGEKKLNEIHLALVEAAKGISILGVKSQNDMLVLFPPDLMTYGLGSEILVEVTGFAPLPIKHGHMVKSIAAAFGQAVRTFFPDTFVECHATPLNREHIWNV